MTVTQGSSPQDSGPHVQRRQRVRAGAVWATVSRWVIYALLLFIFIAPFWGVLMGALSVKAVRAGQMALLPNGLTLSNFMQSWETSAPYFLNSVLVAGAALALQVTVSTLAAYALARKKFVGAAIVSLLILSTLMLPEEVIAIPLFLVLRDLPLIHLKLTDNLWGMILPLAGWAFSIFVLTEFMRGIPVELEEAARVDGAGDIVIFTRIILPLVRPALGTVTVFGFIMIWDQYLLPLIVTNNQKLYTLPVMLAQLKADELSLPNVFLATTFLALLPSMIVYYALQRYFSAGLLSGAVKG
ncbi:carbohydrate ABC transporter permease [Deinococcus marmoris]|uniref:ABC type sugar transport system, permease protein n=1 Tax=Deinococcus marmoris TaxID=249408 RepID=A0A1U7NUW6_9DEIO|nr:carbohydrate ABC transporter permease [Deinococcus marmoris]OLV16697.1 ABC type sugar transport system, permease protein precursor [Deinococcus marmoris]